MPTDIDLQHATEQGTEIASRRILRLALGAALAMFFSQAIDWPLSFIAPIFTVLLLSLPLPAPSVKNALVLIAFMTGMLFSCYLLLPFIQHSPMAGVLLLALTLYGSFLYTARGGSPLLGSLFTLSLTLTASIGSVNIDVFMQLPKGLALGAFGGFVFVWLSHALLPDLPAHCTASKDDSQKILPKPDPLEASRSALRSLVIVFPVTFVLLCLDTSISYTVIMIKIATMGQQATTDKSRIMGRLLLESTIWGGLGASLAWMVMGIWPSLIMYTLVITLAGLVYGPRIFRGAGMHPKAVMWQYAFVTMITVLAPTVGSMASGQSAADKFWLRILYFLFIAIYGWFAVSAFDAFWPGKNNKEREKSRVKVAAQ